MEDTHIISQASPGDRLVIPVRIGENAKADEILQRLRNKGVEVDLRHESSGRFRMPDESGSTVLNEGLTESMAIETENLDPLSIFQIFMSSSANSSLSHDQLSKGSTSSLSILHQQVFEEGKKTLERLLGLASANDGKSTATAFSTKSRVKDLRY